MTNYETAARNVQAMVKATTEDKIQAIAKDLDAHLSDTVDSDVEYILALYAAIEKRIANSSEALLVAGVCLPRHLQIAEKRVALEILKNITSGSAQ